MLPVEPMCTPWVGRERVDLTTCTPNGRRQADALTTPFSVRSPWGIVTSPDVGYVTLRDTRANPTRISPR